MTNRFTSKSDLCKKQLVLKNAVECIDCDVSYWEISTSKTGTSTIYGNAINKFFDYEETGLNPEDIAKLKAENEELNKRLDVKETLLNLQEVTMSILSSDKDTFIHKYQDAKAEIEQLKSELEQSVKLPCKVGDKVYDNDFGKPTPSIIVGYSFGDIFQDDYPEIDEEQIYFYSKSNRFNIDMSFPISEIGKTIFLSREEAEQSLKATQP